MDGGCDFSKISVAMNYNSKQQIFVVDEEPNVRQQICKTLQHCDVKITSFASAAECLENLDHQGCHLIIAELKMADMDGLELLRRVKKISPWLQVLIISGYGDIPTAVKAIKAGATDFIVKPLDKKSFVRKVKSLLSENGNQKHVDQTLTQAEEKVLKLVLDGMSNREIADLLNRSQRTIEVHRAHIKHKLGADSLVDLVKRAAQMGLIDF